MLNSFFIVIREGTQFERLEAITVPELMIGRGHQCTLRLPDLSVSRSHARIAQTTAGLLIRDLGSRNGTFLNGQRIQHERALAEESRIEISPYRLRIFLDSDRAECDIAAADDSTSPAIPRNELPSDVEQLQQKLTPTQHLVYESLMQGMSRKDISRRLGMMVETVHSHTKVIYKIFRVGSHPELIAKCSRRC